MPFTLQVTAVLVVLVTMAENESVSPSNTLPDAGLTVTVMLGGGGGVTFPPPPPPQAARQALTARTKSAIDVEQADRRRCVFALCFVRVCGRGRMFFQMQTKGQREFRTTERLRNHPGKSMRLLRRVERMG